MPRASSGGGTGDTCQRCVPAGDLAHCGGNHRVVCPPPPLWGHGQDPLALAQGTFGLSLSPPGTGTGPQQQRRTPEALTASRVALPTRWPRHPVSPTHSGPAAPCHPAHGGRVAPCHPAHGGPVTPCHPAHRGPTAAHKGPLGSHSGVSGAGCWSQGPPGQAICGADRWGLRTDRHSPGVTGRGSRGCHSFPGGTRDSSPPKMSPHNSGGPIAGATTQGLGDIWGIHGDTQGGAGATVGWGTVTLVAKGAWGPVLWAWGAQVTPAPHTWLQRARGSRGAANSARLFIPTPPPWVDPPEMGGREAGGASVGAPPTPQRCRVCPRAVPIYSAEHGTGARR